MKSFGVEIGNIFWTDVFSNHFFRRYRRLSSVGTNSILAGSSASVIHATHGLAQAVCCTDFAEARVIGRSEKAVDNTLAMSVGLSRLCGGASRFLAS
jgi:hypothetical protein